MKRTEIYGIHRARYFYKQRVNTTCKDIRFVSPKAEKGVLMAISKLREAPAADVVEVVRCKDCKYAFHHPLGYIYCHRDGRNAYEMVFKKDSFCSYGERKDGE